MCNKPLISIITASYNYENYIQETIESVINQTYTNWELIIVDDGSSDNSVEIIKSYCRKDSRIKLYQHLEGCNKGLAETLKLGISKANGEWISFLESDDKFMPECLEEKIKIIENCPKVNFIFSEFESFDGCGIDKTPFYKEFQKKYKKQDLSVDLIKRNWICTFSIVTLKKNLLLQCDFNSPIPQLLDWWLWVQISQKTKFYYLNKKLTMWRIHSDSYVSKANYDNLEMFYIGIERFYNKHNIIAQIIIALNRLSRLRKNLIRIKFGKNSYLLICGKTICKSYHE